MGGVATILAGTGFLQGSGAPLPEGTGESVQISTIKKFADDINQAQSQQWNKIQEDIRRLDTSYQGLYGKSIFSDAYQNDLKKFNTEVGKQGVHIEMKSHKILGQDIKLPTVVQGGSLPTVEEQSYFFFGELQKGEDYIFQRDGRTDYDNKDSVLGKALGDIQSDFQESIAYGNTIAQMNLELPTFIDPNLSYGYAQDVPHTEENATKLNQFQQGEQNNIIDKLLSFLKNHPNQFNSATVAKAIENERTFMKVVMNDWNMDSINKAYREGDYIGAVTQAITTGANAIEKAGEEIIDDVVDPLKPFYDLLKDLWENAGTYIEVVIGFVIVVVLLYLAGQIKYLSV